MSGIAGAGKGFTLIELIIALTLSAFILIGIVGVATQMIRFQMEGKTKGEVTGWTLLSLAKMNKELENASVLDFPSAAVPTGDYIAGCSNYTRVDGNKIDASLPITAFWYCVETSGLTPRLLRYSSMGACPKPMPAPVCGSGAYEVYATDFHKRDSLTYFFRRADEVSGVEVNYTVGTAPVTIDPDKPPPVFFTVQNKISMNKSYNNAAD